MFGPLTRRHPMRVGDHVLALADKSNRHLLRYNMPLTKLLKNIHPFRCNYSYHRVHTSCTVTSTQAEHGVCIGTSCTVISTRAEHGVCMPAEICGRKSNKLLVEFCDGKK